MIFEPGGSVRYQALRFFAGRARERLEAGVRDPRAAQAEALRRIVRGVMGTDFEASHPLRGDEDLHGWRTAVPVRTHDQLLPWLDRVAAGEAKVLTRAPVRSLLETSGTTGRPKWLPVTDAWAETVADAQACWILGLLHDDPSVSDGKSFSIVSPAEHARSPGGLPVGANTGRMFLAMPFWMRARSPVPYEAFCVKDPELRAYVILRHAITQDVTTWTTANPSTILLYCRHLQRWWADLAADCAEGTLVRGPAAEISAEDRAVLSRGLGRRRMGDDPHPCAFWNLRRINCWTGGSAGFFVPRLPAALGREVPVRDVGITASEGFFAVTADAGDAIAFLGGHVLEFLEEDGTPRWAWEVEAGREYRLVISTEAGLYRYDMGDIVRVTGWAGEAPRLVFVRRAGNVLNATGEKVTEDQVLEAAALAFPGAVGLSVSVGWRDIPNLRVAVEGYGDLLRFDLELQRLNVEYASRRRTGRMGPPSLLVLPEGTFARWRRARVAAGAPEAQVKDPIVLEPERWDQLVAR